MSQPPATISCVECGGVAHLLSYLPPDEDPEPGTSLAYRCEDCNDRFDIIWEDPADD